MGQLVFQATLGGQVSLSGPNTASTYTLNVPAVSATLATTDANTFTATQTLSTLTSPAATALTIQSAGTTAITVDTSQNVGISSGNLLLGTTSSVGKFNMIYSGTYGQYIQGPSGASTLEIFFCGATNVGSISTTGTVTAFNVSSDRRLKENIVPLTSGLTSILAIKPSEYNYKSDPSTKMQGFIADELQQIIPHAVTGETNAIDDKGNPIYQGVDASFLVPHLVSAIQEQQALIESLTTRLTALENK